MWRNIDGKDRSHPTNQGNTMSVEYERLKGAPYASEECPRCKQPFPEFMRGMVQSALRRFLRLPYCAVICHNCKNIIGWEKP